MGKSSMAEDRRSIENLVNELSALRIRVVELESQLYQREQGATTVGTTTSTPSAPEQQLAIERNLKSIVCTSTMPIWHLTHMVKPFLVLVRLHSVTAFLLVCVTVVQRSVGSASLL